MRVLQSCFLVMLFGSVHAQMHVKQYDYSSFSENTAIDWSQEALPWNAPCKSCVEDKSQRTANGRYFTGMNDKSVFYKQQSAQPLHFFENGEWVTIDYHLNAIDDERIRFESITNVFPTSFDADIHESSISALDGFIKFNNKRKLSFSNSNSVIEGEMDSNTIGRDGVMYYNAWPGIDIEQRHVRKGIKTNYIIRNKDAFAATAGWLTITDRVVLPAHFNLERTKGEELQDEDEKWYGKLRMKEIGGGTYFTVDHAYAYDKWDHQRARVYYELKEVSRNEQEVAYELACHLSLDWLNDPAIQYPVTIDPLVRGYDSLGMYIFLATSLFPPPGQYLAQMGFTSAALGTCNHNIEIKMPGGVELISTYCEMEYWMTDQFFCDSAWVGGPQCVFQDVAMEVVTACGSTGQLMCNPAFPPFTGTCTSDSNLVPIASPIAFPNLLSCFNATCDSVDLLFTLQNSEYACAPPVVCSNLCAEANHFAITVIGRTLELEINPGPIDTPICLGDQVTLSLNPVSGVPPYQYEWLHNGGTAPVLIVEPNTENNPIYYVEITDSCGDSYVGQFDLTTAIADHAVAPNDMVICSYETPTLNALVVPGAYYDWSPGWAVSNPHSSTTAFIDNSTTLLTLLVIDSNGCADVDSVLIAVEPCVGISHHYIETGLLVHPNPAHKHLTLSWPGAGSATVEIWSMDGKLMYSEDASSGLEVDVDGWESAVYIVKVISESTSSMERILLSK